VCARHPTGHPRAPSASPQVRKSASRQVGKSALVLRQRSSATILPRLPRRRYHLLVTSGDVDNQRAECRRFGSASVIEYLFAWGVGFFPNQALWIIKFFLVFFETRFEPLAGLSLLGIDFRQFPPCDHRFSPENRCFDPLQAVIFRGVQTYPRVSIPVFLDEMSACVPALPSTQEGREDPPILEHRGKSPHIPRPCPTSRPLPRRRGQGTISEFDSTGDGPVALPVHRGNPQRQS
jgi:hypothetical protein